MHLKVAQNAFYQALARSGTAFIGFLITVLIAQKFGLNGFGDFTKITSYVALFYLAVDFGLNAFFLQYEKPDFRNLFYLRNIISLIIFFVINIIVFILPYNSSLGSGFSQTVKTGVFIYSFTVFTQSIIMSTASIFQARFKYFYYMVGVVSGALVNLFLIFIFVFLNFSIYYVLVSFLFGGLVSSVTLLYFTKEKIFPLYLEPGFVKKILSKSWPIGLMLIFNLIYFRADMFILSMLKSSSDVGIYGLAYKFFDFLIALPLFLSNAVYPLLLKTKNNSKEFYKISFRYFWIFLVLSLIVIIPFWFASPLFAFIRTGFIDSIIPFRILLISLPFFFTTSFMQWILITQGKQKFLMWVYLISTITNIILNIIFIPAYSYLASSVITVLSEGLVFLFLLWQTLFTKKILEKES